MHAAEVKAAVPVAAASGAVKAGVVNTAKEELPRQMRRRQHTSTLQSLLSLRASLESFHQLYQTAPCLQPLWYCTRPETNQ